MTPDRRRSSRTPSAWHRWPGRRSVTNVPKRIFPASRTGGSRTALERQQTLRATVEWSHSLLTGAEQLMLARLSVFAGSFDLAAAEAVCGSGDLDVPDVAAAGRVHDR
jgi:hypothetical protein